MTHISSGLCSKRILSVLDPKFIKLINIISISLEMRLFLAVIDDTDCVWYSNKRLRAK